ncbi:Pch2p Ecym_7051 [Eremothecium cymbalariae DBVPG|uniref:AAA+ ATPase domain-containing protein n=1 Tax=Eremothecium cymbalariae (strain CBS 270.75 / DBVPG 7215 / KCTC 17166 / NRRL Y-17582) TaxID=931890 RepID=G8JVP2_ERECY|nr:hypothetical protein Ecym_7051 [Eremothecium cymbalariae DBVPG\
MSKYIVDCCLNHEMLYLVLPMLQEVDLNCQEETIRVFKEILTKTIQVKLDKLNKAQLLNRAYSSKDFLMEGQGSVTLASKPTKAQESFIKSLIKVVLHDFSKNNSQIVDYQGNLLTSLCIERIYIEETTWNEDLSTDPNELLRVINDVLSWPSNQYESCNRRNKPVQMEKEFRIHFYQIPHNTDVLLNSQISEEFDKIDLRDPSDYAEKTYVSVDRTPSWLPFSEETLNQIQIHLMPSLELENVWESLYFDDDIKEKLFSYATIALNVSQYTSSDPVNTIADSNRLLLIHGPPGTGKTTICKALCQKLAIRQNSGLSLEGKCVPPVILIELSCSKVFSRWFGESSKNVDTLFKDLQELLKQNTTNNQFVCLLIDEVETIAFSRASLINKNETTDAIRVVNTLLTQLDNLKKYRNFITLATSNLLDSMDPAFIDRADGIFHIPKPSTQGCKSIIESSIKQLIDAGIIKTSNKLSIEEPLIQGVLEKIVTRCSQQELSGRTLRKLPLKAISEHFTQLPVDLTAFLVALASSSTHSNHEMTSIRNL